MLKRLLMRLFNFPPSPDWLSIANREGRRFWVYWQTWEHSLHLHVVYRGHPVGIAELFWNDEGALELASIEIFERDFENLSHQGLGKAMIQEIIRKAQELKAPAISGSIAPIGNRVTVEYLANWYKRQGFAVQGRRIYLRLPSP